MTATKLEPEAPVSARIWTIPNLLSLLRLLGVPLFLWLALGPHADGWAFGVLAFGGLSDYADGKIARRFNQSSRLGALLDPAADRLYILATIVALTTRDIVPLWLAIAIPARDILLAFTLPVLRRHGYGPLPVNFLGKAATLCLLYAFPLLLLGDHSGAFGSVARAAGWAFTAWGAALYWWAGWLYVVQFRELLRSTATVRDAIAQAGGCLVKAVVMAGGEGSRLRPMTANLPKPLLPVANRPVLEHVLRLLRRHGITDTVVTVQFLASLVRNYFGDGDELGMRLQYATEQRPLGTAGSVKNAQSALRDDTFLVLSGDALTDADLTRMIEVHHETGALVTVGLKEVADPVEYGIVVCDPDGRVNRFLEKPTWGQVFSDTVNTGIYVMSPDVLDEVPADTEVDWSADVFPRLLAAGAPVFGYRFDGYWEDVGTLESYRQVHVAVLNREVEVEIDAFEVSPGVWIGEGAEVDPDVEISGPVLIGDYSRVEAGARLDSYAVLGANVVVKAGAEIERAVVHDNVFIGPNASLRGCVIGRNTDVMRAARIDEGAVVGDDCVVEQEAFLSSGVRVYPFKTVEAGALVTSSVIWESRGHRSLFGPRGVSGLVNVEITPDLAVRLASAWATTLHKGDVVIASRDVSRAATALKRAVVSALTASAIDVRDLEVAPAPVARFATAHSDAVGGIMIHTTPGDPQSVDLVFLDEAGADLTPAAQRRLERVFSRQEFRRAFPEEIGRLSYPARLVDTYAEEVIDGIDCSGVAGLGLRVVVDTAGGAASVVLPSILGRLRLDSLVVNGGLDETAPTETLSSHMQGLARLGELVASSRAAFGVRFDPVAERLALVDERGQIVHDDRALLVVMDLVAAERRSGRVAVPVTTTRVAEQVAAYHGVDLSWTTTATTGLSGAAAEPGVIFAADGRGGFIVPEFSPALDGIAAFVRLCGLIARTKLTVSEIDARIPAAMVVRRALQTPWSAKGAVMRAVVEAAGSRTVDTTDGIRVVEPDGRWVLVLPDPADALTHLWAEAGSNAAAVELLDEWTEVIEASHG